VEQVAFRPSECKSYSLILIGMNTNQEGDYKHSVIRLSVLSLILFLAGIFLLVFASEAFASELLYSETVASSTISTNATTYGARRSSGSGAPSCLFLEWCFF